MPVKFNLTPKCPWKPAPMNICELPTTEFWVLTTEASIETNKIGNLVPELVLAAWAPLNASIRPTQTLRIAKILRKGKAHKDSWATWMDYLWNLDTEGLSLETLKPQVDETTGEIWPTYNDFSKKFENSFHKLGEVSEEAGKAIKNWAETIPAKLPGGEFVFPDLEYAGLKVHIDPALKPGHFALMQKEKNKPALFMKPEPFADDVHLVQTGMGPIELPKLLVPESATLDTAVTYLEGSVNKQLKKYNVHDKDIAESIADFMIPEGYDYEILQNINGPCQLTVIGYYPPKDTAIHGDWKGKWD